MLHCGCSDSFHFRIVNHSEYLCQNYHVFYLSYQSHVGRNRIQCGCCSHSNILLWFRSRVFTHLIPTTKGAFSAARHERAEEDVSTAGTLCSTNWHTGKSHCGCWQSIRRQLLQYLEEAVSSLLSKVRLGDPTHSELWTICQKRSVRMQTCRSWWCKYLIRMSPENTHFYSPVLFCLGDLLQGVINTTITSCDGKFVSLHLRHNGELPFVFAITIAELPHYIICTDFLFYF